MLLCSMINELQFTMVSSCIRTAEKKLTRSLQQLEWPCQEQQDDWGSSWSVQGFYHEYWGWRCLPYVSNIVTCNYFFHNEITRKWNKDIKSQSKLTVQNISLTLTHPLTAAQYSEQLEDKSGQFKLHSNVFYSGIAIIKP